jgi:hypothetical protein
LLESYGFDVAAAISPDSAELASLDPARFDVLLIDRNEDDRSQAAGLSDIISSWSGTVLYNDSVATEISLQKADPGFGAMLAQRINSLAGTSRSSTTAINQ